MNLFPVSVYSAENSGIMKRLIFLLAGFVSFSGIAQMAITSEKFDAEQRKINGEDYQPRVQDMYEVLELEVDAVLKDQVAEVSVKQLIQNPGKHDMEVQIMFPLPNDGVVQNFVMMVDGKEVPGQLLPKDEARAIYEGIVNRKKDPALMEYVGYGLFKTSVFPIAVGQQRIITMRYTQLCSKQEDLIRFAYPFGTQRFSAKPLRKVSFTGRILASKGIKNLYSPTDEIQVKRDGDRQAEIKMEQTYVTPDHDFKLMFSLKDGEVGANLLSYKADATSNGYYMLMASPSFADNNTLKVAKNIVFVLDRSGSMAGKKIEQSRKALEFVLGKLNKGDRFNIVIYDDRIESFAGELVDYNDKSYKDALLYVRGITSAGGTNIHDALQKGLSYFTHNESPNYMLFLTDGLPTAGDTQEKNIVSHTVTANKFGARVFAFGVGDDVNARLLDRLSMDCGGKVEYVTPNEDIETAVGGLYSAISEPVLTNIEIAVGGIRVSQTYPAKLPDLFRGGQLVWVGQYSEPGATTVTITGKVNGKTKKFDFPVEFTDHKSGSTHQYVEKIWASKRVAHILTEIDQNGSNKELIDELVNLSKKYGILTPYTSFLAREDVDFAQQDVIIQNTSDELDDLKEISGAYANQQREMKNKMAESNVAYEPMGGSGIAKPVDQKAIEMNVLNVGQKTFYKKNNIWIDGSVSETEKSKAIVVNRFSTEYFNLAKGQSAEFNTYLSVEGNVLVKLNNRVYNIVP
jgi:Ca-activated chloride channel family protein